MTNEDFELFKNNQYCDNPQCQCYLKVGGTNIVAKSRKHGQVYCKMCKNCFSVRKGTVFFGLRTPMPKIITCLNLLASGIGVNAVCRAEDVTSDSLRSWLVLAAEQVTAFTAYMQHNMHLEQVQIDEFWSYVEKKRNDKIARNGS